MFVVNQNKNEMKNLPTSNEYTQETIQVMADAYKRIDEQVQAYCADVYKSAVVRGHTNFPANHPPIEGIEALLRGCASDADAIRDVCSDTHEYLCSVSKAYSYSEFVLVNSTGDEEADVIEGVKELLDDYFEDNGADLVIFYNYDKRYTAPEYNVL